MTTQPRQRYFFSFYDIVKYKWNTISRELLNDKTDFFSINSGKLIFKNKGLNNNVRYFVLSISWIENKRFQSFDTVY